MGGKLQRADGNQRKVQTHKHRFVQRLINLYYFILYYINLSKIQAEPLDTPPPNYRATSCGKYCLRILKYTKNSHRLPTHCWSIKGFSHLSAASLQPVQKTLDCSTFWCSLYDWNCYPDSSHNIEIKIFISVSQFNSLGMNKSLPWKVQVNKRLLSNSHWSASNNKLLIVSNCANLPGL